MTACYTCGGWVAPVEALHTDQGVYHDWPSKCLSEEEYERLVAKWGCECGQEYRDHLEEEHREDQEVGAGGAAQQHLLSENGRSHEGPPALTPWSTEELAARERRFMDARLP